MRLTRKARTALRNNPNSTLPCQMLGCTPHGYAATSPFVFLSIYSARRVRRRLTSSTSSDTQQRSRFSQRRWHAPWKPIFRVRCRIEFPLRTLITSQAPAQLIHLRRDFCRRSCFKVVNACQFQDQIEAWSARVVNVRIERFLTLGRHDRASQSRPFFLLLRPDLLLQHFTTFGPNVPVEMSRNRPIIQYPLPWVHRIG
ncbi:hypothetical protein BJV82DRAFT_190190 [Fennellomyces sp. T-0311]|nr:hypothetical protein BJV82DRAFT_190190 [Fennellomyces sp. T-0311]